MRSNIRCIHCQQSERHHLTMDLCPDDSGRHHEGNAGYDMETPQSTVARQLGGWNVNLRADQVVRALVDAGWDCGDCLTEPGTYEVPSALECLVHEAAHNLIVDPVALRYAKNQAATKTVLETRHNTDRDEVRATAITVLVCRGLGVEVERAALRTMSDNLVRSWWAGRYPQILAARSTRKQATTLSVWLDDLVASFEEA